MASMAAVPTTHNQWGVRLACALIKESHGSLTEAVCRQLAQNGTQGLHDIIRGTGLPSGQVKSALLLMMQHNFVAAATLLQDEPKPGEPPKPPIYVYRVDLDAVLAIIRFPRFLQCTRQEFGPQEEALVELLLRNGRLTFNQMVSAWAAEHKVSDVEAMEPVRNLLFKLVLAHYVERAPPCDINFQPAPLHPDAVKKKGGKAGSAALAADQSQMMRGADEMQYDKLRYQIPKDLASLSLDEATLAALESSDARAAAKPLAEWSEEDEDAAAAGTGVPGGSPAGAKTRLKKRAREQGDGDAGGKGDVWLADEDDDDDYDDDAVGPSPGAKRGAAGRRRAVVVGDDDDDGDDDGGGGDVEEGMSIKKEGGGKAPGRGGRGGRGQGSRGGRGKGQGGAKGEQHPEPATKKARTEGKGGRNWTTATAPWPTARSKVPTAQAGDVTARAALAAKETRERDKALGVEDGRSHVLWRVNMLEFNRHFRHQACVATIRDKYDEPAARVLEAMLAAGRQYESQLREERGSPLSFQDVRRELRRLAVKRAADRRAAAEAAQIKLEHTTDGDGSAAAGGAAGSGSMAATGGSGGGTASAGAGGDGTRTDWSDDMDAVQEAGGSGSRPGLTAQEEEEVERLCDQVPSIINSLCDELEFLAFHSDSPHGALYCVGTGRIIEAAQIQQLRGVAYAKWGLPGMRIFNMLSVRGSALEQKQVSDIAMLPQKETRELLYKMLMARFMFSQDVPKSTDRAPSRTFYTWRVDWPATAQFHAADLLRAVGNVVMRTVHERTKRKELVNVLKVAKEEGKSFAFTHEQLAELKQLQATMFTLEATISRLDESIALFAQF